MHVPSASNPLLTWDPAARDPAQRRIHPLLRGAVLSRDGWSCGYCGRETTEVDHVDPQARGGATTPGNLVAACRACNQRKGLRTPAEWRRDETLTRLLRQAHRVRAYRRWRSMRRRRDQATMAASSRHGSMLQKRRARPEVEGSTQAGAPSRGSGCGP